MASSPENKPEEGAKPSDEKVPERKSSGRSPGKNSGGEVSEGEPSDGEVAEGEPSDGEDAEGDPSDVEDAEGEPSGGEVVEVESSGGEVAEVKASGGRIQVIINTSIERKSSQAEVQERQLGEQLQFGVCYLCKREVGGQSHPIYIPQCQKEWLLEEAKKPENERRPLPPPPYDEVPIKVGGPPQEDDFGGKEKAAFEASLAMCPHCQRQFVPKALQHHSTGCTEARPFFKPAGTGLNPMSLTNRLVPGIIAGSQHGLASEHSKLSKKISLFKNWKIISKQRATDLHRSPSGEDFGQSSKPKPDDPCGNCGTLDRSDSKFCSSCGKKRPVDPSSPSSSTISKEDHQAAGGRESPIAVKDQDKLIVQSSDPTLEIVIQMRPFTTDTRPKSA